MPSNCSLLAGGPKNKAAVFVTPAEPDVDLAVLKSPDSVQLDPSHFSVLADCEPGGESASKPPKIIALVFEAPTPPPSLLEVFTSPTSVHAEPFQDSLLLTLVVLGLTPNGQREEV